jgi:beta-lactamase regulating signal transducer with metallopeptidase domain
MILSTILPNLLPWIAQITVIALVAALMPVLFQVRHPRTQLVYCHLMLVVCLLLPFLEPWRHPVFLISGNSTPDEAVRPTASPEAQPSAQAANVGISRSVPSPPSPAPLPFWRRVPADGLLLWILAAGVLGRLSWLLVGLWHIRRYRIAATPLYPIPESVQAAAALTHADALFCISSNVPGPVMLGVFRPVVLLPESFLSLDDEAQCGIAAHELLHVQRKDWLVTALEEISGALMWFNPAVWWLLSQTRLAREQLVDAEAVRLTSAREPYIHALLAIARMRLALDLAPAPLFLRRRHLTQRMHSLLKDVSVSGFRLLSSYASIAVILALAGWLSFVSFPLVGLPQVEWIAAAVPVTPAAQASAVVPSQPVERPRSNPVPVPADGQEPVTGPIQIPATPAERAAALALLERARQNSDMHIGGTPSFQLDATFLASGNVNYVGSGAISETWMSGQRWRWTANLADYSQARIGRGQGGFDEQPVSAVPMRVHMLREAIFWPLQFSANPRLRTAALRWNGNPVTCLLLGGELGSTVQSRLWTEQEYCIDNASGLVQVKSPAPGTYWMYGYGKSLQFHGRFLPDRITAWVGGAPVLDAQITIADAGLVNADLLTPSAAMIATGLGTSLTVGPKFQIDAPGSYSNDAIQTVIVHAELAPAGNVLEEEVSASADSRLSQAALDLVKQHGFPPAGTQREVYVNVRFTPATQ